MIQPQGQYPPITTPFANGRVSTEALERNLARWNEEPLHGYLVLGSNGEAPLLDEEERRTVIRAARRAIPAGRRLMIVGTGRESTTAAIRSTREAFDMGTDVALVGVPTYYKPEMKDPVLEKHLRAVADASPGPVLLYSVPQLTSVALSPELVANLATHPRVIGIKDSAGDLDNIRALVDVGRRCSKPFHVLVGNARILAESLLAGATAAILAVADVAPRLCSEIAAAAGRGDLAAARHGNERLEPLRAAVTRQYGVGGLKAALDLLGYDGGEPRPPLQPPSEAARAEIASHLQALGLLA